MENSYIYTGKPIVPNFDLNFGDTELKKDIDYDISAENNINVGTATLYIKGKGKFDGIIEQQFKIEPVPAKNLKFYADNTVFDYTGEPIKMQLTVKYGEEIVLEEGRDYTIAYMDNIEIGRATAQMTFRGNFTGIMNIPFLIKAPFVNESWLSADKLEYGSEITIYAAVRGGKPPYSYSYYSRSGDSTKWTKLSDYTSQNEFSFKPNHIQEYVILVRMKDADGRIADHQIPFSVISKISGECSVEKEQIQLGDNTKIQITMLNGTEPFEYHYIVRLEGTTKWITLKRNKELSQADFSPKRTGVYDICVKVSDANQHQTKMYAKLSVLPKD